MSTRRMTRLWSPSRTSTRPTTVTAKEAVGIMNRLNRTREGANARLRSLRRPQRGGRACPSRRNRTARASPSTLPFGLWCEGARLLLLLHLARPTLGDRVCLVSSWLGTSIRQRLGPPSNSSRGHRLAALQPPWIGRTTGEPLPDERASEGNHHPIRRICPGGQVRWSQSRRHQGEVQRGVSNPFSRNSERSSGITEFIVPAFWCWDLPPSVHVSSHRNTLNNINNHV